MAARKLHTIEKRMIPASDRDIRVLILRPTESARPQENTPGILWLHGGGHLHGMYQKILLSHARFLVEKHGAVVVAPEYRTAFEKPFPADLEDCYAALLFLNRPTPTSWESTTHRLWWAGKAPAGGLTVATCLLARDLGEVNVALPDAPLPHAGRPGDRLFARQSRTRVEHAHQPICLETLSPRFRRHDATVLRRSRPGNQLRKAASCLHLRRHCRAVLLRDA